MRRWVLPYCFLPVLSVILGSCAKEYSYEGGSAAAGYLVKDFNNDCSRILAGGTYIISKRLADNNFLQVTVYVRKAGHYTITTPPVNGYSFAASGNFTDTGFVEVKLPATGKPILAGTDVFTLQFDSSYCEAGITVLDTLQNVVPTNNPDHFPLADANKWSYDDLTFPGDSVVRNTTGTSQQNGSSHWKMNDYISFYPANNASYFRRNNNDYFQYCDVCTYTSYVEFSPTVFDDVNFLKEGLQTGDAWYSGTWTAHLSVGAGIYSLRFHFRCIDADATAVINDKTFVHVYKVEMRPELAPQGQTLQPTTEVTTTYYAKGIGLIYAERFNTVLTHPQLKIRNWVVN